MKDASAGGPAGLVEYQDGGIVSRTLHKNPSGSVTAFAFDRGQSISEHTVPFDAVVLVLDGKAELTVGGEVHRLQAGEHLLMPARVSHAVAAPERFKMLLTMLKSPESSGE